MNIQLLPLELQIRILKYCEISDIPQISSLNHYFNHISHDRTLWLSYCRRDFPTFEFEEGDIDFYEVYHSQLHRYKNLIGVWIDYIFSKFVRVKLDKNLLKVIACTTYFSGEPLGAQDIFEIPWIPENNSWDDIVCKMSHQGNHNAHSASIDMRTSNEVSLSCDLSYHSTLYFRISNFARFVYESQLKDLVE